MIPEKYQEIFARLEIEPNELKGEMLLEDDIGMDSQELIELHVVIEKMFNIKLPEEFITKSMSVNTLIESVDRICE
ncbi:MAG: acyl carrier protein [Candidatus Parabeggiatoa sp.]|nr:acyl carrier protein [Candidatus Parabeggiatoa sp.]